MTQFPISNKAAAAMIQVMQQQDMVGIKKYGKPLDHQMNYNWLEMAFEELADLIKYLQCEHERKADVINILHQGLNTHNPKMYIDLALNLLMMEGTSHD